MRRARFNAVRRLTLFFPDNFGDGDEDVTRISYLGFRGEWTALGRAPQNILYEAAANPGDHKYVYSESIISPFVCLRNSRGSRGSRDPPDKEDHPLIRQLLTSIFEQCEPGDAVWKPLLEYLAG